jgi:hypothetical protein
MIRAVTLAVALALRSGPAPEATAAYDEAVKAWEAKDWPAAADAFGRAFELDPRPELMWGRAQALRFAGDCAGAIEAYERFVALDPPEVDRESARNNIEKCTAELEADAAPEPAPEPPPPVVPNAPPRDEPPPKRWYADPAGMTLFVGGLAVAAVGAGLVGSAHTTEARARDAATEQGYRGDISSAQARNAGGIACLAVGGALIVGATIRFIVVARRSRRSVAARGGFELRF